MKIEHKIVNIILYISHMYRSVVNFLKFWLNSGYWKSFKALESLAGLILRFKMFLAICIWLVKITRAGYPRLPEVDSIGGRGGGGLAGLQSRCQKRGADSVEV
jgi:hypothetical protein